MVKVCAPFAEIRSREILQRIQPRVRHNSGAASSLKRTVDGRMFVPADVVLLLGDGAADRGTAGAGEGCERGPAPSGVEPFAGSTALNHALE
jgi:hypothetical protein